MKIQFLIAALAATGVLAATQPSHAQRADYEAMVAGHAQANGVPVELVHRVIVRESRYRPGLVGHGGTIGLMQIKLATARGVGYTGTAEGLRDPNTNLTYAVKYLAGAYRAANGDHNRAVSYYAGGYYYAAKRQQRHGRHETAVAFDGFGSNPADAHAQQQDGSMVPPAWPQTGAKARRAR
jgi:soluble lytic murein transglycosylase-like protein